MLDTPSESSSPRGITYDDIPNPSIGFAQPYEFEEGEEFEGHVNMFANKWNEWYKDIYEHGDFIELEDIICEESYVEHEVDVSSLSLELMDPTYLRLTKLAPTPSPLTYLTSPICDHLFDPSKFPILVCLYHILFSRILARILSILRLRDVRI